MRMRKLLVGLMALTLLISTMIGSMNIAQAATASVEMTEDLDMTIVPGETTHIKIPIKAIGEYIPMPKIEVAPATKNPFTISNLVLTMNNTKVSSINLVAGTYLEFDVKTKSTAAIGEYPVDFTFTYSGFNLEGQLDPAKTANLNTILVIKEEKAPAQLTASNVTLGNSVIGSDTNLTFALKNEGGIIAKNVSFTLNYGDSFARKYTTPTIKVGDMAVGETETVSLPITILSSALAGRKSITLNFTYKTEYGDAITSSYDIFVDLKEDNNRPNLSIKDVVIKEGLKAGEDFTVSLLLNNGGTEKAENITVSVDDASISKETILKNFYTDVITVSNINSWGEKTVKIPLTVSKYATSGLKDIKINISYTDAAGVAYTLSDSVYADVLSESTKGNPNIVISNVKQSPSQPIAGEKMSVSFDLENKGQVDISELKVSVENLSSSTFIPLEAEPYQYYEKLEGGKTIRITLPLNVSDTITAGLNNLILRYSYSGSPTNEPVTIPIRDVQNDSGSSSKPKLIVSKYVADTEELRAGTTFNFTFDIYNTHSSIAAKNITVTITQADNIFSVTQGSNSFFVSKIAAGESASQTVELKVKSDATTKAYPIKITIEYEYDGIEPNPETGEIGETKLQELNLQVVENSRPVIDYVNVYSWEGPVIVGNPATLYFEFYNMGRAPLNNVIATVSGDFTKSDGNMYFIGNVTEGGSSPVEFDVIPNVEGTANGVLTITFEDSNGDEVEFIKEFQTDIMPMQNFDPGVVDGGFEDVFNPGVIEAKKVIVPLWLFIIIQVVIFIVFIPVTRKIIISVYKAKLHKKEQEQY